MFTGRTSPLLVVVPALAAGLIFGSGSPQAQTLRLSTLRLPPSPMVGSWVSYRVAEEARGRPSRRFTQRLAVVAQEGADDAFGYWVELRTQEARKTKIERGFFGRPEAPESPRGGPPGESPGLRLLRYQALTPDGRLLEYPLDDESNRHADQDVSAMGMFEFAGAEVRDSIGTDTLRVGERTLPCRLQQTRRYGMDEWEESDTNFVSRALMVQTLWRNPEVALTGYARSILEISPVRTRRTAGAAPDSAAANAAGATPPAAGTSAGAVAPPADAKSTQFFYRSEATLTTSGTGAVPEVTQAPEPAPEESTPRGMVR